MTAGERVDLSEMNRAIGTLIGTVETLLAKSVEAEQSRQAMAADIKLLTTQMDQARGALHLGQWLVWFFVGISSAAVAVWVAIRVGKTPTV